MNDPRAREWSRLHHGVDPASVPGFTAWLRIEWWLARGLRAVPPTLITLGGVLFAAAAAGAASSSAWWALAFVVVAVLCDGLDGAVAVVAGRATRGGAVADAVADRICDAVFAVVLWRCGAPWALAVVAGVLAVGVDLFRRARRVPDRITVAERPTFAICAALACGCRAVDAAGWTTIVCAAVWIAACLLALTQLARPTGAVRPIRPTPSDSC